MTAPRKQRAENNAHRAAQELDIPTGSNDFMTWDRLLDLCIARYWHVRTFQLTRNKKAS